MTAPALLPLRRATPSDIPAIVALINTSFSGETKIEGNKADWANFSSIVDGERTSIAALTREIEAGPQNHLLVVTEESTIVACVCLEPPKTSTGKWYLGYLSVSPRIQKGGCGRRLLLAAEAFAVERGATSMRLSVVNERKELIEWYERRGYVFTGELEPFPYGSATFGEIRWVKPGLTLVYLVKEFEKL